MRITTLTPAASAITLALAAMALPTQAQQLYRIVGPDGKVTFSDRAPAGQQAETMQVGSSTGSGSSNAALPSELRQAAAKFPVTLYTGPDCSPCLSARSLLMQRGIPFTEKTVTTNQDVDALKRLSGGGNLPFGTIGGQHLVGFESQEWSQYLDAAGYPKQSRLPPQYKNPEPAPLVAVKPVEAPAAKASAPAANTPAVRQRPAPAAVPSGTPTPQNPAGIRF